MSISKFCLTTPVIAIVSFLATFGAPVSTFAQTPVASPAQVAEFEELPELKASEILKPEYLQGPHHKVRESVPTASGANQFVIDSDFGVFDAEGNEMLARRVREVYAIEQLKGVSRTDQFKQSLVTAAKGPYKAAKNVVQDPGAAVSSAGKGIMKFMGRVGQTAKNVAKGQAEKPGSGKSGEDLIGYTRTKQRLAISMGIDPFSTNTVLQKELDGVAWASWAGGFTFSAATLPIGGPAGAALTATSASNTIGQMLSEKSPGELRAINRSALRGMGTSAKDAERFLENTAFSPTQQTAFVFNLKSLDGVANRSAFVHSAAGKSSNESDAMFCVQTSMLLGQVHGNTHPLARIAMIEDFPVGVAKDGTVIVALQWDYAAWTPGAAAFTAEVEKLAGQSGSKKPVVIALSGQMSPRLQQELQRLGFTVHERVTPGPLK